VYSGAFLSAGKAGIPVGKLRILSITGSVPQDILAAAPDMPAPEVKRLREALIRFEPKRDIGAHHLGEVLAISGFAAFEPADLETIREAAEEEGMIPPSADQDRPAAGRR
jgi:ABC-type phosphate/phosphonate transport system substrate-binding protein